jgi:hypothetical protein
MQTKILYIEEPSLTFGYDQKTIDPRDGLALFGPHQPLNPYTIRAGIIGTSEGIKQYGNFVETLNKPIYSIKTKYNQNKSLERQRPSFPGFEAAFNVKWPIKPEATLPVSLIDIQRSIKNPSKTIRTNELVDIFLEKIVEFSKKEDYKLDIWFVIIPIQIFNSCKPKSWGKQISKGTEKYAEMRDAGQMSLGFKEYSNYDDMLSRVLDTSTDFHHLLKARLIQEKIRVPIQLIVDRTLRFRDREYNKKYDEYLKANLAWVQSTTLYYKLGKLPWKLGDIREGVCYIGLVFKKLPNNKEKNVCSAAQMFLRDGDGSVFRGNIGLWESKPNEFHLDETEAEHLIGMALDDYKERWGQYPKELFIHSRTYFDESEWRGFSNAAKNRNAETNLVGILIKDLNDLKLYRHSPIQESNYGVLRGTALKINDTEGYLCTKGFIPRLNTSNSLEMPRNLRIKIIKGESQIETVLKDILALTKLNYNSCVYGDGIPVTLKFSNKIGSILTSIPEWKVDTRQFMYYI